MAPAGGGDGEELSHPRELKRLSGGGGVADGAKRGVEEEMRGWAPLNPWWNVEWGQKGRKRDRWVHGQCVVFLLLPRGARDSLARALLGACVLTGSLLHRIHHKGPERKAGWGCRGHGGRRGHPQPLISEGCPCSPVFSVGRYVAREPFPLLSFSSHELSLCVLPSDAVSQVKFLKQP